MATWLVVTGTPATLQGVLEDLNEEVQVTVIAGDLDATHPPSQQLIALLTARGLNLRDAQIAAYSFAGYGRRRIEARLGISSRTLRRAWRRILQTLDVPDRTTMHKVIAVLVAQEQQ
jgi:DNA-binding NarL/FixJ family response regulator